MQQVVFVHGKESGPWGAKSLALAEVARRCGWRFLSPDLRATNDPDERVGLLLDAVPPGPGPLLLIGSSMGGYVATCASERLRPATLLLLAPAFYLPGYRDQDPCPHAGRTVVVHGRDDALIPPALAWRFVDTPRRGIPPARRRSSFDRFDPLSGTAPDPAAAGPGPRQPPGRPPLKSAAGAL